LNGEKKNRLSQRQGISSAGQRSTATLPELVKEGLAKKKFNEVLEGLTFYLPI